MEADLDTHCPICLENWDSAAYTIPCCHQFCFHYIQRWTSTRPQSPLCKQGVQFIIHSVQADNYKVLRPAPVATIATGSPAGPQAARPWPAVARRPLGGLSPATWASVFRGHPALLQPLRSRLQWKLFRILGAVEPRTRRLASSIISAMCIIGLEEKTLRESLDLDLPGHAGSFIRQFIAFAIQRCSREAHSLLGLNISPAAGAEGANSASEPRAAPHEEAPVSGPAPSDRNEMLGREGEELEQPSHSNSTTEQTAAPCEKPEVPGAGPSGTSLAQRTRRAPKRKARVSQPSTSTKKRPPRQQE